jgi:hypothetical protein
MSQDYAWKKRPTVKHISLQLTLPWLCMLPVLHLCFWFLSIFFSFDGYCRYAFFLLWRTNYIAIICWGPGKTLLSKRYMGLDTSQPAITGNSVSCLLTMQHCPSSNADIWYHIYVLCAMCMVYCQCPVPPQMYNYGEENILCLKSCLKFCKTAAMKNI